MKTPCQQVADFSIYHFDLKLLSLVAVIENPNSITYHKLNRPICLCSDQYIPSATGPKARAIKGSMIKATIKDSQQNGLGINIKNSPPKGGEF